MRHSPEQWFGEVVQRPVMIDEYWLGITRWHHGRVSNGLLEGLNSLIQAAKRDAPAGTAQPVTTQPMIDLVAGKLKAGPQPT